MTAKSKLMFKSQTQRNYVEEGRNQDDLLKQHVQSCLGLNKAQKVESKRHTIISGPPGVGKSFSTMMAIQQAKVNFMMVGANTSISAFCLDLAHRVSKLKPTDDLIVLVDDADNVIFGDYDDANAFKTAMAKKTVASDPYFSYNINLVNARASYLKKGRQDLVDAIDAFTIPGQVGISIPTSQVRFFVICNRNLENHKEFTKKMWTAVEPIVDRVKYKRLVHEWQVAWGWLAYTLESTQPFPNHHLTLTQKTEIMQWMWDHWPRIRNQSYRTVEELAEHLINDPMNYEDSWNTHLKVEK